MTPVVIWLVLAGPLWATIGALVLPRRYRRLGLDASHARLAGGLIGAFFGLPGLAYSYRATPSLGEWTAITALAGIGAIELLGLFKAAYPDNPCVTDGGYVANQVLDGVAVGLVYATMAIGLALIFSVQGIVSFAHGQLFMLGGVLAYLFTSKLWNVNPLVIIPLVAIVCLLIGIVAERFLLSPLHSNTIDRPVEYALLVTFGFGMFLQYSIVGALGTVIGIRVDRYTDHPILGLDVSTFAFGPFRIRTDIWIAAFAGLASLTLLTWFLRRTWTGMSLRAVAMDRQAAAVVGINVGRSFTAAFGVGAMLAGAAGALLIPVINFPVPQIAAVSATRAYVIIVLGGLGSVPGAVLGGLFIGVTEALGAGCFPDPSRGATYQIAFGLLVFALVLLVRPEGLFGRKE